ncbi:hypothetical protein [Thermosporothrix hazakensis]|jgi:hypothetical protein|nr:hypothetical protein [Thermosporothrix hazakensis]
MVLVKQAEREVCFPAACMPPGRFNLTDQTIQEFFMLPTQRQRQQQDREPSPFSGISVQDFIEHTVIYEHQPLPFTTKLKQGARAGMLLSVICAALLLLFPLMKQPLQSIYFPFFLGWLNNPLTVYMQWISQAFPLQLLNGSLFCSGIALLVITRNLRQGHLGLQWIAFAQALGGSLNMLLMLPFLLLLVVNLLAWFIAIGLAIIVSLLLIRLLVALVEQLS